MIEIRSPKTTAEWEAYYDLRYRILRQPWNQPRSSAITPEDRNAAHFALFEDHLLKAVARVDFMEKERKIQVRFVAVEADFQGKGYGKKLMKAVEQFASENNIPDIILEARENAVPFYLSLGYVLTNQGKLLFESIPHFWMEKKI